MGEALPPQTARGRADANRLALSAARAVFDAAHDFQFAFVFDEKLIRVVASRAPGQRWPDTPVEGASEGDDGPWPAPVRLEVSWPGGATALELDFTCSRGDGRSRSHLLLRARLTDVDRDLLSIRLARALFDAADGEEAVVDAPLLPPRRREAADDALPRIMREAAVRAGLTLVSESRVEAFRVAVPEGRVVPSPREAFVRLTRLSLLKMPFALGDDFEGDLPFLLSSVGAAPGGERAKRAMQGKRAGVWALPGGVRQYKETLDALLGEIARHPMHLNAFFSLLRERYDASGETARKGYLGVLTGLGYCAVVGKRIEVTPEGGRYLARRDPAELFARLHKMFIGVLETLVIVEGLEHADNDRTHELLRAMLGTNWESFNQSNCRRNWLLSLGLTERSPEGDSLTDFGRRVLDAHGSEARPVRARLRELLGDGEAAAEGEGLLTDVEANAGPGLDASQPPPRGEPSAWTADRVDLRPGHVAPHAYDLELPEAIVVRAAAALSTGKHLLLVGPPGTGKTELAHALVEAAKAEGYCAGAFVATASADWTTFDTIGGYALHRDGALRFRAGALLKAVERWQWLVVDELNRADVDRAFGELMTVLAGRTTDTAYENESGATVRIGPDPTATHPMPKTFRVLATMNTWDKTSLFRLSYAVQRRFAIVHVDVPGDAAYARLLRRHAGQQGLDPPLDGAALEALVDLFSSGRLLGVRQLGPALPLDVIRYVRRRAAADPASAGDALAEALAMFVLPQFEGLDSERASRAFKAVAEVSSELCSPAALGELAARFADLFPHVTFSR